MVQFTELSTCVQSGQGHTKWRVISAKQMLALFEPQWPKRLTDVVTGDDTFIWKIWCGSMKPGQTSLLRPGFHSKKRLLITCFNYPGPLVVDVLSEKTTMTSRHYTGSVLPKVVAAVRSSDQTWEPQEHWYSMTMVLPTKQGPQFSIRREKSYMSCPTHPTDLT